MTDLLSPPPLSPPPTPATLADVARLAGVSKMTASNVINGKPGMSEATRQRVLRAVEQTGYVANPAARRLAGRRSNLIGVLAPRYGVPYVTELLHGALGAAEDAGMNLAVFTTSGRVSLERERAALLRTLADGVLLILPSGDEHQMFEGAVPVVTAGSLSPYSVRGDNAHGGLLVARHLLALGHRRVAYIRGPETSRVHREESRARERGLRDGLREGGVDLSPPYVAAGDFTEAGGERAAHELLRLPEPPTAIFAANDSAALGVLRAAEGCGVRVPGELSVVGYDDVGAAARGRPPLTTVRQPLPEMGGAAVRMLLDLVRGVSPAPPPLFPTTLIVRDSTGPPPSPSR
ncbi:LacI family DNA-binding transcriptional regulator [Deinococcus aestuarii]|uniref:LacI family DNA-binding transcriptional regulator n=1 Tax=Deinococcus aestuarii TaxID=2774531 RepID=UPI001C0AAAFB|nr:LacI family DNA-binding transcriptional regulator [Deinococcus aestuarii]